MDFNKIKNTFKVGIDNTIDFVRKYKRYFLAAIVFALILLLLFSFTSPQSTEKDPLEGAYQDYVENSNEEIDSLIKNYYSAYADGDVDTLEKYADPISPEESSYIAFYSQYIESFDDITIYTKQGLDEDSYIVSVEVNIKFVDIDTKAPGFDFFYVNKNDDGNLIINNLYGSFNQANGIYEMDPEITSLIATFISQDDVRAKEATIQQEYNEAILNDEELSNFVNTTLQDAIVEWNVQYQQEVEAQKAAEEEAEAQAAADEEAAKEAEAAAAAEAEEEANAYTGTIKSNANVRASADTSSDKLGKLEKGSSVTIYATEGDFYKIDYNGTKAYVSKDLITTDSDDNTEQDETEEDESNTSVSSLEKGTEITLDSTVNIRSGMDSSSSKVAVAYAGEKVTVVMSYAEGWTKVKYGKKEGYIRTDLLTD